MGNEGEARSPVDSPMREARRGNERWITGFVLTSALVFAGAGAARALTGDVATGAGFALLSGFIALYYVGAWRRAAREAPGRGEAILRTMVEGSAGTAVILLQAVGDPDQALLNAPVLLYVLAIFSAVLRLRPALALLAGGMAAAQWLVAWALLVTPQGMRLEPLQPLASVERAALLVLFGVLAHRIGATLARLVERVAVEAREREQVRRAFGAYVAEPVVERVLKGDLVLATERRVITVLFVDIRGFTTFSDGREPTEVLARLNQALEAFSIEVRDRGGIVNKFLGDGLMALFGAPVEEPFHARQGVEAALAIVAAARGLDARGAYPGLRVGIGVHCGEVVVGDIGGRGHREYTAIGDVVNVASRVEGLTRDLGEEVLITEAVAEAMGTGFRLGEPIRTHLRGRDRESCLYAVRGAARPDPEQAPETLAPPLAGR